MPVLADSTLKEQALVVLRRAGNPFRNYFARHPDDEVCTRYHVPELYAREREQLLAVVDLFRGQAPMPSEVVPVLGNKGAGKTHLLHSIKHGPAPGWQLLVTPGTFQKGADFAEYLLFQIIDTLLGGGTQRGQRPIEFIGEEATRRQLRAALAAMPADERIELFPQSPLVRWARRLGLGGAQAQERAQWLIETLGQGDASSVLAACQEAQLDPAKAHALVAANLDRTEPLSAAGQMRRRILDGFARAVLLGEERPLAEFLTDGFAGLDFQVRPGRQELALALIKALMDVLLGLRIPVVVAFDQLEDLLLARRTDDGHKVAEAFFAGIVQMMHQVNGVCFLIFAERGLWNRFVPSLDGYIQDRLNNPIHVPKFGTIKALRLEAPPEALVGQVVAARMRPALADFAQDQRLGPIFPFTQDEIARIAKTEPTLRDMLQQFRHLFDHRVFGQTGALTISEGSMPPPPGVKNITILQAPAPGDGGPAADRAASLADLAPALAERLQPAPGLAAPSADRGAPRDRSSRPSLLELWEQEVGAARKQLEPEGALTGATRELNAGLGQFLGICHDHGVKVGMWRLGHVAADLAFGDHPAYGVMTVAHWAAKDGQPYRLGLGLFLGRGPGKLKDLQVKLTAFNAAPPVIDQLVLLRPADDTTLAGKSKALWDEAIGRGCRLRLEPLSLDEYAILYAFPRWLTAVLESLGEGQPLPNLADFLQEQAGRLLAQMCLPSVE